MRIKIIGTGSALPDKIVTNEDLSRKLDTTDEWIRTRTGIRSRRIAEGKPEKKLLELSFRAAEQAIAMAGERFAEFSRQEIDLIITATCTPDMAFPAASCRLQAALSAERAAAFDLSLACSGFLAALDTASAYLESGRYRTVLVVGADVMSRMIDWTDRNSAVLFGDGAGAVLLSSDTRFTGAGAEQDCPDGLSVNRLCGGENRTGADKQAVKKTELPHFILRADGSGEEALFCKAMYFNEAAPQKEYMDGRRVFEFAVRKVPEIIGEMLRETGTEPSDIRYYILHQANYRIIEAVAKRIGEPIEKFPHNIENYGNTTAASIPILLDEMNRARKLAEGDLICLSGFGAGLSYGAALLEW